MSQGLVYAVGRVRGASGGSDFAIFAFDAVTGAELWESVTNLFQVDIAFAVAGGADAVFAAGPVRNFSSLLVRAYDAHCREGEAVAEGPRTSVMVTARRP